MLIYITGPSGCGKSRLVLKMMEENGFNQNIAWMPQNPVWFKGTLLENLCPVEMRSLEEVKAALALVNLEHFTQRLNERVWEYANNFSGGEKRRLAIARIILLNRPVWILDEPFAGLDKANAENIQKLLEEEGQRRNILCIRHVS